MLQHTTWSGYIQIELKGPLDGGGVTSYKRLGLGFIGLSGVLL